MKQYIVLELNPSTALNGKQAGLCGQTSSTFKIDFKRKYRISHDTRLKLLKDNGLSV
jgi:hypothetical protein